MILLSCNPLAIFVAFGLYIVVFFIVWTILFYFFEKVKLFNITNKFLKRIVYFSIVLIAGILSFYCCELILDLF
jgi:hypothetical protein